LFGIFLIRLEILSAAEEDLVLFFIAFLKISNKIKQISIAPGLIGLAGVRLLRKEVK